MNAIPDLTQPAGWLPVVFMALMGIAVLAYVVLDGYDLGEQLILQGLAVPATQYLRGDPQRAARYVAAAEQARSAGRGAYAGEFIDPARWRRGERLACEARY